MKKQKINLGCTNIISNIKFLYNEFNVVKPYVLYKNNELIKNFDYLLLFDANDDYQSLDIPTIGCKRVDKSKQMLYLNKLGINTPKFYKVFGNDTENRYDEYYTLLEDMNDECEIILKPEGGARGLGQILLKKKEIYNFFEELYKEGTILKLVDNFNIGGDIKNMSEEEIKWSNDALFDNSFFITEKVNIKNEYRVMLFYGEDPIIIQRSVDKNWQANISLSNSFKVIDNSNDLFNSEFNNKLKMLLDSLNSPFLSTDIYEDINGNFGLFEYQMQFGYKSLPKSLMIKKINKSVHNLINDKYVKNNI